MKYDYIDVHSHLNFPQFDEDREAIIADLSAKRIATITVGTTLADSKAAIALAEKHEHLFATVGIHPTHEWTHTDFPELDALAAHPKVVAIGECGLDFFRAPDDEETKKRQSESFSRHIEIALKHNKPLMIHCRNAYEECLAVLKTFRSNHELGSRLRGNMHFFVGSVEIAQKYMEIGFTFSFDGPITFARDYDEVITSLALDRIMSETDAPFAAPAPFRGKRNQPIYVQEIAHKIAEIRGEDIETVKRQLVQNAQKAFGIA